MSNIWKRSLSMVLALVMVFGMMPMQVFATGTGDAPLEQVETPTEAPTAAPTEATEHVHVYGEAVTTAATCTADGVKTFTCTCGDSYTEVIAAPGHAYENGVCACGETEPTEAPVAETEPPVMAPAPTEDPVQALIDSLPASVNSQAEYDAVYDVVAEIENNGYDLSADQMDAVFAAMNAADEWFGAEEAGMYAEADGWYWDGNTLYIKNGQSIDLYDALVEKYGSEPGKKAFKYDTQNHGSGTTAGFSNWSSSKSDAKDGSNNKLTDGTTYYAVAHTSTSYGIYAKYDTNNIITFTVKHYYKINVAITGPADGSVVYNDVTYLNGATFNYYPGLDEEITVNDVDGWNTPSISQPTASGALNVVYTEAKANDSTIFPGTIAADVAVTVNGDPIGEGFSIAADDDVIVVATYTGSSKNTYISAVTVLDGTNDCGTSFKAGESKNYIVNVATASAIVLSDVTIDYNASMTTSQAEAAIKALVTSVAGNTPGEMTVKYYGRNSYVALDDSGWGYSFGDDTSEKIQIICGDYIWEGNIALVDARKESNIQAKSGATAQYYKQMDEVETERSIFNAIYNAYASTPNNLTVADVTVEVNVHIEAFGYTIYDGWLDVTGEVSGNKTIDYLGDNPKVRIVFNGNEEYKPDTSDEVNVSLVDNRKEVSIAKTEVTVSYLSATILADMITEIGANYDAVSYKYSTGIISNGDVTADALREAAAVSKGNTLEVTVKLNQGDPEYKPFEKRITVSFTDAWYTVTWYEENGETEIDTTDALIGTTPAHADASKAPTVQYSYTFAGWEAVSGVDGDGKITGNAAYKATFTGILNQYTITFIDGNGEMVSAEKYDYDTKASDIVVPTATKKDKVDDNGNVMATYTFEKWDKEIADVTGDATYTATFTEATKEYTIIFKSHDGEEKLSVPYGSIPQYTTPSDYEEGDKFYAFKGWNSEVVSVTGDATYEAVYTDASVYKVTFDANGGTMTEDNIKRVIDGEMVTAIEPIREGYRFDGWYLKGEKFDFNTAIIDDITLTAKWVKQYTVTYTSEHHADKAPAEKIYDVDTEITIADLLAVGDKTDSVIMDGWYIGEEKVSGAYTVTTDVEIVAKWLADENNNEVVDEKETVTVTIVGNGSVNGNTGNFEALYDSVNETTISLKAVPVIEEGSSKSYVSSIAANGAELELEYTDYCVELDAPVEGHDVVVTFTDCGFVYDEDGKMRFYVGMENPNYETLYKAVVVTPEYSEQFVTAKYLARPAATYKMQVPVLFEYTVPLINYDIKIGGNEVELDLDDAWLDVGESFKTLTPEQLQSKYDTEIQKIKDKIAAIDLSDISWDNADDKIRQFAAIRDELTTLIETISNEAEYLGYHQFGASDLVDEDGNVQEILQIVYDNGAMHLQNEKVRVTLEDDRTPTVLTGGDVTVEYDEYNNDSLLPAIKLTTADGTPVNGEVKILVDMSGKNVGEYTYTAEYAGGWDYKPATATFTLTVVKAPSNVDVLNQNITYGTTPSAPVITNKHGKVIDIDTIEFIIGLDVAELDVDGDGVKGLEGKLQLVLTEELQTILSMVGLENGAELNINELISALTNTGLLEQWGISGGVVDTLKQALDSINGIVEANNLLITIGGGYPTNIGAYLHGAVTVDANYETAFDVGYIIIRPDASRVYLDWNYNATDGLFTPALLEQYNLSASAYDDAAFETLNTEASQFVNNLFFGLDVKGELVAKFYNADIDPETIESELDNGAYTQMAFAAKFGNKLYYSVPIVRAFAIIPNLMDVQVVVDGAEIADLYTTVFDGAPVDVTANLTVAKGAKIPGDGEVKFHYYGIKTNTETYDSDVAPTNAGAYAITATYQTVDENGKTTALGVDVAVLVIEPTTSTIKVENKIGAQDAGTKHYFGDQIKAASAVEGLKPDTTIMTAGINTDGSFSENGWDAVTGTVNVDFPRWVDALIAQYAPSVLEGVTLQEFSDKLLGKLPEITEKMEEIGATNEMVNSLKHAVTNVSKALEKMPKNVELSFNDNAYATGVGAYVIVGIVTDSDHIPSMDAGILVLTPDVETVELKWNYEDENHIWTRELLKLKDLKAKAFDLKTGAYSEAATEKITYQFIGIDKNGELVVVSTTNPDKLPNGAYIELAYIGLAVDGAMTCSNLIARDLLIVPNTAEVTFVDANNNNARIFTFDNTPKAMEVQIVVNGAAVEPAEGELTLTYMGVQTNTKTYNSTTAPTYAGVYTIVAEYRSYTTEGSLAHIGSAVGMMAIAPAASTMDVTGDTLTYDGEGHTATVKATGSGVTEPDYTLISGGAYVSGDINKVGVDAFHGNVNIDFPAWLDKALAEHEFAAEGVNTTYLIEFISAYRDDVLALIPAEKLAQLGIETEKVNAIIEKLNAYIDELLAILEKLPKNVILTFKDDVTYTEPGYYFYYGIVTDSDHYPASDTGLLVIEKKPLVFDLLNTTATWNGNGQMVDLNNPENADFTTVVIDRKHNTINILLDEDAQYALNAVAKILGVEFDGDVQMSTIIEKYNGEELAAAIVELIGQLEQLELPEDVHKALAAVKKELETLPETGTIMINGDLPTELGKYEVYGLSYAQYFETAAAEAVLEIVPVQVEVILDNITKAYGEADPALTYTVNYYDHLGNKLDDAGVVDVTVTREEGEHVGTYAISAVAKLNDDAHYVLIAQPESATFEITKAEDNGWSEEPSIAGWTYGEEPNEPTGAAKYGEIKVEYRPADGSDADFTETVPTDAGDYVVRFTVEGTDNYNGITIEKELSIEKAASEIKDAPEAVKNLTYTGDAQELITAGTAEGGKVVYSLSEEGPFTNQIPAGTDADKYIVYYKVEGDENHTDTEVKHVEVTISKATPDVKAPAGLTAVEGQTLADVKLPEGFAWANAETTSVGEPGENKFVAIFTPADSKNYEAVRVEVIITVEEDNSKDGLYPIRMKADHETIAAGAKIYVDGVAYELDEDLIAYVPMDNATFVTTYVYNKQSSDTHEVYPTHMYVWQLTFSGEKDEQWVEGENYTAKRIAEFDDIMQYAGSSIRISGKKGIRMITSVPTAKRNTLIKSNLLGWRLMQTGTCVEWADENGVIYNSLTMNTNPKLTGYAYKRGVQDPVFARTNGLDQFTNVLVGFNNDQCKLDLVMRPYMILENVQTGETAVLYGGMVQRSIGYIAYQNRLVYKPGNAAYNFIWDIIHHVYGNKYDADFKG